MNKLKQKLMDMKENAFCFVHLIANYVTNAIKGKNVLIPLERHLKICPTCAEEKHAYETFLESSEASGHPGDNLEDFPASTVFKHELEQVSKQRKKISAIKTGQIWSTPGFPDYPLYQYGLEDIELPYSLDPRPFLIYRYEENRGIASGFPINTDYLEFASDFDLIVAEKETELEVEFMIEVWNPVSTGKEFLQKYWGQVPVEIMKKVDALANEFNGITFPEEIPGDIVTGKPIHFENDIRCQFQELEHQITEYISAPLIEKQKFEAFQNQYATRKMIETMIMYAVIYIHRHKDFLRTAGEEGDNNIYLYSKEQPIFDNGFILKISINERHNEYLLQLQITDYSTGEETRSFVIDIIEWEGEFPEELETLKMTYLFLKKNGFKIKHIRLWEKEKRLTIPVGKNIILGIYKTGDQEQIEFIPIDLGSQ